MNSTKFYYSDNGSPDVWTQINIPSLKYTDSVGLRSRLVQAIIPDAGNVYIDDFFAYQRIKLVEAQTGDDNIVFLGRVEDVAPQLVDTMGQVVVVACRDYIQELIERKVNTNYSAAEKRSVKIDKVITDYMYTGAAFPRTVEASGSDGTLTRNLTSSKLSPLEFIEEMAQEDPWTNSTWDSPAGAVWRWNGTDTWVDDTAEADSGAGTPFALMSGATHKRYFGRNNPFAGLTFDLAANGSYGTITWEYWNGSSWVTLTLTSVYVFAADGSITFDPPADWAAKAFSDGDPHAGAPLNATSRYWIRMSVSAITTDATVNSVSIIQGNGYDYRVDDEPRFHYFRRGSKPAGGPSANGLTIEFGAAASAKVLPMLSDYEFSNTPKEVITRVTVRGNDSSGTSVSATETDSALETQLKIVKERIEYVYGATTTAVATQRAKSLLRERGNSIITHGKVAVMGLPFYYIGSTCYLLRAGDLVRIKCTPKGIDEDFLVLEMSYEEPACITTITLLSHAWGRGWVAGDDLDSVITEIRKGLSIPMASIGDLIVGTAIIADLSVTDAKIVSLAVDKLTAGSLTVAATLSGSGTLRTGSGNAKVEVVPTGIKAYDSGGVQRVQISSDGSGWLGASSGAISWTNAGVLTLAAATVNGLLTAATISVTNLTAGNLTVAATMSGSGTMKSGSATARVEMTTAGIKAYDSSGNQRVQISNDGSGWFGSSTGFAWTAAGALSITGGASGVKLSSAGLNIWGDAMMTTRATEAGTIQCKVDSTGAISAGAGAVLLNASGIIINCSSSTTVLKLTYSTQNSYIFAGDNALTIQMANASSDFSVTFSTWGIFSIEAANDRILLPVGCTDLYVASNLTLTLGASSYLWKKVYTDKIHKVTQDGSYYNTMYDIRPYNTSSWLGAGTSSGQYWSAAYIGTVYYQTLTAFDDFDDIELIKQMKPKKDNPLEIDPDTIPSILKMDKIEYSKRLDEKLEVEVVDLDREYVENIKDNRLSPEEKLKLKEVKDKYLADRKLLFTQLKNDFVPPVSLMKELSLAMGAIKQMALRIETLEKTITTLQKK